MSVTLRIILILFSVGFFGVMWILVARKKLALNYALLWLALSATLILTVAIPGISMGVSAILGFEVASNFIFFVLIGFILLICTSFSIHISTLTRKSNRLMQLMSIREYDVKNDTKVRNHNALVIIPAYNESESILNTVIDLNSKAPFVDYVIINDGSTDNTADICRQNNLNFIDLPVNLGIGGAVQTGYQYARKQGYDIAIQFDGDGQHDAAYISQLIAAVQSGADLVIGSRFIEGKGFQSSAIRRVGIKWISFVMNLVFNRKVTDPTSGFRACGKNLITLFADQYPTDYPEPETLALVFLYKYSYIELPVKMNVRSNGVSSINWIKSLHYILKVTLAILNVLIQK